MAWRTRSSRATERVWSSAPRPPPHARTSRLPASSHEHPPNATARPRLAPADGGLHLASDTDEQLLINIPFQTKCKLASIVIKGPADKGPKTVKLYANRQSMGFSDVGGCAWAARARTGAGRILLRRPDAGPCMPRARARAPGVSATGSAARHGCCCRRNPWVPCPHPPAECRARPPVAACPSHSSSS
jgi:hypothetical protein